MEKALRIDSMSFFSCNEKKRKEKRKKAFRCCSLMSSKKILFFFLFLFFSFFPCRSFSQETEIFVPQVTQRVTSSYSLKDFFFTSLYGTLLGSIVGTVTMGFDVNENQNPRRIAVGASLGFYGGILVGLYSLYSDQKSSRLQSIEASPYSFLSLPFVNKQAELPFSRSLLFPK